MASCPRVASPDLTTDLAAAVKDACRLLEHDDRTRLEPVLLAIVDRLEQLDARIARVEQVAEF